MDGVKKAFAVLREHRNRLTRQQVRTLSGQIKSGNPDAAMKGLQKIINRAVS